MGGRRGPVIGWKLDRAEREALLQRLPPEWPDAIADHVTLEAGAAPGAPLPAPKRGEIIGEARDGEGVQAMVVRIDRSTARPDGGTWHVTWSLDRRRGRRAVESNDVIAGLGWRPFDNPIPLTLIPSRF